LDDRVAAKSEVIVSCGARSGILCSVSQEGFFICDHPDLDVQPRLVSPGDVVLSAQPRPGRDHVRISVGEKLGVVMVGFSRMEHEESKSDASVEESGPEDPEEVTLHVQEPRPARKRKTSGE